MIGHERRRGHSALRPPLAAIYCRANDAESARSLWIERSGGTNWALRRPGANPGTCPVARIGRASPSAHPVGRQPIRGPVPARTRTPVRRGLPGRGRGCPGTRDGPPLSALSSPPPLERRARGGRPPRSPPERRARGGRPPASPTGRRTRRDPPRQRRAGFAVRRRPARVTPQRGGGGGRAAPRRSRPDPEPDGPGGGICPPGGHARSHGLRQSATDTLRVMRLLILGGTVFLGRHVAAEALARGHDVTVFHRGRHGNDLFAGEAEHLIGDRSSDLSALEGRTWDAAVDTSGYQPEDVAASSALLAAAGVEHLAFVSTCNVYPGWPAEPVSE